MRGAYRRFPTASAFSAVSMLTQCIEFLGLILVARNLTLSLTSSKAGFIKMGMRKALQEEILWLRLVLILGNITLASATVPFAQVHARALQALLLSGSKKSDNLDSHPPFSVREIRSRIVGSAASFSSLQTLPNHDLDLLIFSDASLSGWSSVYNGVRMSGTWSGVDRTRYINQIELLAAFNAPRSLTNKLEGRDTDTVSLRLNQISRCLQKIWEEQVDMVLVFPFWPSQPWFAVLLELAYDVPVVLRPTPD